MKIDKVVFSTTEEFSPWWNIQSYIWKEKFNIEPVCILWGDINNTNMKDTYGEIIEKKYNPELLKSLQMTWSKFYHPHTEPEKTWLIGDIDMVPLTRHFYVDNIEHIDEDAYVHIGYDVLTGKEQSWLEYEGLPAPGHVAKGKIFSKALGLDECSFEDQIDRIQNDPLCRFGQETQPEHIEKYIWFAERNGYKSFDPVESDMSEISFWQADERYSTWRLRRCLGEYHSSELPGPYWIKQTTGYVCGNMSVPLANQNDDKSIDFIGVPGFDLREDTQYGGLITRVDRSRFSDFKYNFWKNEKAEQGKFIDLHGARPYSLQESSLYDVLSYFWGEDVRTVRTTQ